MLAARPKTLTGAAVPVMLGCALAASDGDFHLLPAVLCLLFAFLMQIDANLINDLWDYLKGSDGKDRLGPERACAQGWITPRAMRRGIALTTAAACITGCGLLFYGGWWLIAVGALCVAFAFLYTAGPYPLAYHGWGDLLVLLAQTRREEWVHHRHGRHALEEGTVRSGFQKWSGFETGDDHRNRGLVRQEL